MLVPSYNLRYSIICHLSDPMQVGLTTQVVGVLAEIQNGHLHSASQSHYCLSQLV
jgi:hypothetical protein